jgi:hypothetical protein
MSLTATAHDELQKALFSTDAEIYTEESDKEKYGELIKRWSEAAEQRAVCFHTSILPRVQQNSY